MPPSIRGNMRNIQAAQQRLHDAYSDLMTQNTNHQLKMLHLQQRADRNHEMVATRSNIQKAHHDVMMLVAGNMK